MEADQHLGPAADVSTERSVLAEELATHRMSKNGHGSGEPVVLPCEAKFREVALGVSGFWKEVLEPLVEALRPERIVEVGAERGATTELLLGWAESAGATLHSIDPEPDFDVETLTEAYPATLRFHRDLSLEVLPALGPVDLVLLDGDHNYYTVFNELKILERAAREKQLVPPVIGLHDIDWPYGRRDVYYNPETVPEDSRRSFERRGLDPRSDELVDDGLNADLANATRPAERHSGVCGAIEDFLAQSSERWRLFEIPGMHGLGILAAERRLEADQAVRDLLESTDTAPFLRSRVEAVEWGRIDAEIERVRATRKSADQIETAEANAREAIATAEEKAREQIEIAKADTREAIAAAEEQASRLVQAANTQAATVEERSIAAEDRTRAELQAVELDSQKKVAQAAERETEATRRLQETSAALLDANQQLVQIPVLEHRLTELQSHHDAQYAELSARHAEALTSRSWRLTAPLRGIGRLFRGNDSA